MEQVRSSIENLVNALIDMGINSVESLVNAIIALVNDMLYQATHADLELGAASSYVALGDGTAAPESYVEVLAAQLEAQYGMKKFTNYASAGNTVGAELANIGSYTELADADLITIGFSNITMLNNALSNAMEDAPAAYDWAALVGEALVPFVEEALSAVYAEIAAMGMDAESTAVLNSIVEGIAWRYRVHHRSAPADRCYPCSER